MLFEKKKHLTKLKSFLAKKNISSLGFSKYETPRQQKSTKNDFKNCIRSGRSLLFIFSSGSGTATVNFSQ